MLGVDITFPGFARTDLPPPAERTRPEDHPYARHTARIRVRARIGYCLDYGSRKDDPLPKMGVLTVNPAGSLQRAEIRLPKARHLDTLEGIILWPETAGEGAFVGDDGLARGRIRIDRSEMHEVTDAWANGLRTQVSMIAGVPMYMADEMNRNARSAVVRELKALNDKANAIYEEHLRSDARWHQWSRLDLTTAKHDHGWFSATDAVEMGIEIPFTEPSFKTIREKLDKPEKYDQFFEQKHRALATWASKVRPDSGLRAEFADWLSSKGVDGLGDGNWDHKPRIREVWGAWNRIGNTPNVYFYDIWSNMHYGFVGRASGFSVRELVWGSNAAQKADTGEEDSSIDAMAVREGFGLHKKGDGRWLSLYDLTTILSYHTPDSEEDEPWGELRRYSR